MQPRIDESRAEHTPATVTVLLALVVLASVTLNVWYASAGLHSYRYWDERYSLENVQRVLTTGSIEPANAWYPSLSYLPQAALFAGSQALHRWTGVEELTALDNAGNFTRTAYLLARLVATLFGAGCLLLLFRLGRRLFSPAAGLLGAFFLAITPWFTQASTMFKPDVLVMTTVVLSLWLTCRAAGRPGVWRFALAGFGTALSASAKLNGSVVILALVVGVLLSGGSRRDRLIRLLAGGVASMALFLGLNPYFTRYLAPFVRNMGNYADRAEDYGTTRMGVLWEEVELVLSPGGHGPVVGALALAGLVGLTVSLARRSPRPEIADAERWVLLSFPFAYSLVWVAVTPGFRGNNFLPVLPVTSLLAGWAAMQGWRLAAARLRVLRHRGAWIPAVALLAGALVVQPFLYVYRQRVPTTDELAFRFLRHSFLEQGEAPARLIYNEGAVRVPGFRRAMAPPYRVATVMVAVDRFDLLSSRRLDAADGEIFPVTRLEEEAADFYLGRLVEAPPQGVRRFTSRPFVARGRPLIAVSHPWRLLAPPAPLRPEPRDRGNEGAVLPLPDGLEPGDVVSFLAAAREPPGPPELEVASRPLLVGFVDPSHRPTQYMSERAVLGEELPPARLSAPGSARQLSWSVKLLRWGRPGVPVDEAE